jgi:hypothetical protein
MNAPIPPLVPIQPNIFRLAQLPAALSPNGQFTLAPLVRRNQASSTRAKLWLGRNFAFNGDPPESYFELASVSSFAFHGQLTGALLANQALTAFDNALPASIPDNPFPLIGGISIQLDGPDLILPELFDFDALANSMLMFVGNEIFSLASATLTATGVYTLTAIRSRFATIAADHAAGADIFVIGLADLIPVQHPLLVSGNTGRFKLTVGMQQVTDQDAFNLDL